MLQTTTNFNFLSSLNFQVNISRFPQTSFSCTQVKFPRVSLPSVVQATPFQDVRLPGDHIKVEPLELTFYVDSETQNYFDILSWMASLGFPDSWDQYASLNNVKEQYTTGTVAIYSNTKQLLREVTFDHLFPVDLTPLHNKSNQSDVTYITATASLLFQKFSINNPGQQANIFI